MGPQGTGGLIIQPGIRLEPIIYGGTGSLSEEDRQPDFLPDALESGTLNGPGIAGLGAGVSYLLSEGVDKIRVAEQALCRKLWNGLRKIPNVKLYGSDMVERRSPIVAFNIGNMDSVEASFRLEEKAGVIARAGLHCAAHAHRMFGTLEQGVVRFSPSHFTSEEEIETTLQAVKASKRLNLWDFVRSLATWSENYILGMVAGLALCLVRNEQKKSSYLTKNQ